MATAQGVRPGNSGAPEKPNNREGQARSWRERVQSTKVGALLFSWDFFTGLLVGGALGLVVALVPSLQANGFTFMITLSGIGAAVAALVLAPMAMLLASMSPQFHQLIQLTRSGIAGVLLPFKQVAVIAVGACVAGLVVSVLAPLYKTTQWWAIWIAASVPIILLVWAVAGCVQVTGFVIQMIQTDREAQKDLARLDNAKQGQGSHAA